MIEFAVIRIYHFCRISDMKYSDNLKKDPNLYLCSLFDFKNVSEQANFLQIPDEINLLDFKNSH